MKSYGEYLFPEYLSNIPFFKNQLQWIELVKQKDRLLPRPKEMQYEYEFRLYREIIENDYLDRIKDTEAADLYSCIDEYILQDLKIRHKLGWDWKDKYEFLYWLYPFKEKEMQYILDDDVIYCYLLAKTLVDLANIFDRHDFLDRLLDVYQIAMESMGDLGNRITAFIKLFLMDEAIAREKIQSYLQTEEFAKYWVWLFGEDESRITKQYRTFVYQQSLLLNNKSLINDHIEYERFHDNQKEMSYMYRQQPGKEIFPEELLSMLLPEYKNEYAIEKIRSFIKDYDGEV